jgi:hypothetical protein
MCVQYKKRSDTMKNIIQVAATASLVLVLSFSIYGQGGRWVYLGSSQIDGGVDHDKIRCHGKDTYRALQFRVTGSAVQFDRINVVYGNHNSEPLPFRFHVAPGGDRAIDLRGGERDMAYVEFWYQKASWGSKPEVRLYGKR